MSLAQCWITELETTSKQVILEEELMTNSKKRRQLIWTQGENQIYVAFLKIFRELFKTEKIRRRQKIFVKLADLVQNRTGQQCRSHHQRMMVSHKSITKIIKYLEFNFEIAKKSLQREKLARSFPSMITKVRLNDEQLKMQEKIDQQAIKLERQSCSQRQLWSSINIECWQQN